MKSIELVFDLLDEWREFPSYQLERRADIYFALLLPDIMKDFSEDCKNIKHRDIIPEFPLKNENSDDYRPLRVDYVVFGSMFVYLIELKTSTKSKRPTQDDNMKKAEAKGLAKVIEETKVISQKSRSGKYKYFDKRLAELTDNDPMMSRTIKIVYIQPKKPEKSENIISFDDIIQTINKRKNNGDLEIRFRESLAKWIPPE